MTACVGLPPALQHSLEKAKGTKAVYPKDKDQHGPERALLQEPGSRHSCIVLSRTNIFRNLAKFTIIK